MLRCKGLCLHYSIVAPCCCEKRRSFTAQRRNLRVCRDSARLPNHVPVQHMERIPGLGRLYLLVSMFVRCCELLCVVRALCAAVSRAHIKTNACNAVSCVWVVRKLLCVAVLVCAFLCAAVA